MDFNQLLHHQRSAQLALMPPGASVFLSAGCSGRWYFDWIERHYGPVDSHIGVEFYSPEPDDLPPNVEWIANTVGDMHSVENHSVDLLFSGQNIEHLWLSDMVGFLSEAHRVLRPGGHLVMDSPNRVQTAALNWSHPEHTVELSVAEAITALELAGFEPTRTAGLWLVEDGGRSLSLDAADDSDVLVRSITSLDRPDESLVWWIEATPSGVPDLNALREFLRAVFVEHWPERMQRFIPHIATVLPGSGDLVNELEPSVVMFGPYAALPCGSYRVTMCITGIDNAVSSPGYVDVMVGEEVLGQTSIDPLVVDQTVKPALSFELTEPMSFGVQFRVFANGSARFRTMPKVQFEDLTEPDRGPTYDRRCI
ncbi:MAG: methyltransferase domain-containing protein [Acidimicrobiales bacterium]|nr:methyltransferase domain-containing protein [Acidimicrobiales bacterium]